MSRRKLGGEWWLTACCVLLAAMSVAWSGEPGVLAAFVPPLRPGEAASPAHVMAAISGVRVTNVSDKSFTVSWTTDAPAAGSLSYGATPALGSSQADDPGAGQYTHHVTLSGLSPATAYYFDVVADGSIDNNGGLHYAVTTGPTLSIPGSDTIFGRVLRSDGATPAQGAIVYVTLVDRDGTGSSGRSAILSALVDDSGYWFLNLAVARASDGQTYFAYSAAGGDDLELQAQGGPSGVAQLTVDVGQSNDPQGNPASLPDLVLRPAASVSVALAPGWNLIAIPLIPADPAPSAVLASIGGSYDLLYTHDACETNPWRKFDPYAPPFSNDLAAVDVQRGYWVRATQGVTLTIAGTQPVTTTISLCPGWNLISYPSAAPVPLPDALASIAGKYDLVYGYDATDAADPWKKFDPAGAAFANDLAEMGAGKGYWLKMKGAATLAVGP